MRSFLSIVCWASLTFVASLRAEPLDDIRWVEGPGVGSLGSVAEINIPVGYIFADGDDTRVLMEAMENPVSGVEVGFFAPEGADWFVVFEFDKIGYVPDDERDSLDADAILKSIKQSNAEGNKERTRKGWPTLNIVGWAQPPRYNVETNNLEWGVRAESEGEPIINWNTRVLGRDGVMHVTLVADPAILDEVLPLYSQKMEDFGFTQGHRYAEYRSGDKLAGVGLTALVAGGATAVAAKTGLLKGLWKFLVAGALGVAAFVKKLFMRESGRE